MFFVTRSKKNMQYVHNQLQKHILKDETIEFVLPEARKFYPEKLRKIEFWDKINQKVLIFITNNFELSARQIAFIYK